MYSGNMPTGSKDQPDEFNEAFFAVVRAKMGMLQLNIADVSRLTDIPRSTLSRLINGKRVVDMPQMMKIANAINMPLAALITKAEELRASGKEPF